MVSQIQSEIQWLFRLGWIELWRCGHGKSERSLSSQLICIPYFQLLQRKRGMSALTQWDCVKRHVLHSLIMLYLTEHFWLSLLQRKFEVKDYMKSQPDLTTSMRAILVDWLVEVQENFELNHETLYLAVKMVDIYLGLKTVSREKLQLIGATALFIASKFDVSVTYVWKNFP